MVTEERIIERIIKEEIGISVKVSELALDICSEIISNYNGKGRYICTLEPTDDINSQYTIDVYFTEYKTIKDIPENENFYKAITIPDYNLIRIFGYTVNGKIFKDKLMEVIQHEIHHVFELSKSKRNSFINGEKETNIYIIATNEANNKTISKERNDIGYMIYLSHDFETFAFENGTYAFIISQDLNVPGDGLKTAKKSVFYQRILRVKTAYNFILNNRDASEKIATTIYGKSYSWLKKTAEYVLKGARRQFGRAVVKAEKDYDWTHGGTRLINI